MHSDDITSQGETVATAADGARAAALMIAAKSAGNALDAERYRRHACTQLSIALRDLEGLAPLRLVEAAGS